MMKILLLFEYVIYVIMYMYIIFNLSPKLFFSKYHDKQYFIKFVIYYIYYIFFKIIKIRNFSFILNYYKI